MAITKSRLFSVEIYPDVVSEECRLWKRFTAGYSKVELLNFLPDETDLDVWESKIELYSPENMQIYTPIMTKMHKEMELQKEVFSPVFGNIIHTHREMTLTAVKLLSETDMTISFALRYLVGKIVIVDCQELVGCSSPLFWV